MPIEDMMFEARNAEKLAAVDLCLFGIDAYCGVKTWYMWRFGSGLKGVRQVRMLGLPADCEMAKYLYLLIAQAIDGEVKAFAVKGYNAADTRRINQSFSVGMARRVRDRLEQMARELEPVAVTATGTALVVVKGALVEHAFAELGLKMSRGSRGPQARDHGAYAAGRAAGDRVNLSRPISGAAQHQLEG